MASLQCISCNSLILETVGSCTKCGHVNKTMRTIAGKRFSGYREELYTRRVIKESRDEYRRKKRESRGIKSRLRQTSKMNPNDPNMTAREKLQLKDVSEVISADTVETRIQPHAIDHNAYSNTTNNMNNGHNVTHDVRHDVTHDVRHDVTHDVKRKRCKRNQQFARRSIRDYQHTITKPLEQLAMAGPLAEINNRLRNQSAFWICLADVPL